MAVGSDGGGFAFGALMHPGSRIGSVYLCREPVDFRKSIGGLSALVEQQLEMSPFGDALFVFINRQRDKIKALYWHRNGFCLWYKRLEKQRFAWPRLRGIHEHRVMIDSRPMSGVGCVTEEQAEVLHALKLKKPSLPEQLVLV